MVHRKERRAVWIGGRLPRCNRYACVHTQTCFLPVCMQLRHTHTHTVWMKHRHKLDAGQGKRHAQGQGTGEAFSILLHTPLWPPPLDPTMLCGNEEERPGGEAKTRRASVAPTTRRSGWREGAVARTVESLTGYSSQQQLGDRLTIL